MRQMLAICSVAEFKRLYRSSGKEEKKNGWLVFMSSTKRKIRHFHAVVVQLRQINVQDD